MNSQLVSRRHGFVTLRYEQLEGRLLLALADVEARQVVGLDLFGADAQYADVRGQGYSVVILDHGLDLDHPYFGETVVNGVRDRIAYHWNFTSVPPGPLHDDTTHGTHVAGIAAGFKANVFSGVAPGANIIALQALREGATPAQQYAAVEAALDWVEANAETYNIVAVNMSFSTDNRYTVPSTHPGFPVSDNFSRLVDLPQRVIPVASVGNRYGGYDSQLGVGYPAADISVLGVGATWDVSQDVRPLYYSLGAGFNGCSGTWLLQYETYVDQVVPFSQRHATMSDIFAPGADVFSSAASGGSGWHWVRPRRRHLSPGRSRSRNNCPCANAA